MSAVHADGRSPQRQARVVRGHIGKLIQLLVAPLQVQRALFYAAFERCVHLQQGFFRLLALGDVLESRADKLDVVEAAAVEQQRLLPSMRKLVHDFKVIKDVILRQHLFEQRAQQRGYPTGCRPVRR